MIDYTKYFLNPLIMSASIWGLLAGGNYAWLGFGILLAVLILDSMLQPDYSVRDQRFPWIYDLAALVAMTAGFVQIFLYAWLVGQGHFTTTSASVGAFVTMMFTQFVIAAPALHEMFHREQFLHRWLGRIGMVMIFDPWREITHVVTHHIHTATPTDPDYARRGENLYRHLVLTFVGQIRESYHLERQMWTKRERSWWDPRNAWVWRVGILIGFAVLLFAIGGVKGMLMAIAICLVGPRLLLEIFNYTQHYGLVTGTPGRFEPRHTWNHLTPFVRILALEITNHAGHHEDSYRPFYALVPDRSGPKQPPFLICVLLALVPPLWFAMIRPRLAEWDRTYANAQERELAEVENERAGWGRINASPALAKERLAIVP